MMGSVFKKPKSAESAVQAGGQQTWDDINRTNTMNRDNATWAMDQNQASMDRTLGQNRVDQGSDYGNLSWSQGPDGQWSQQQSLTPDLQGSLGTLRGKYDDMIGGMGGGFDVQGDVMNAMRGQMAPGLQQQRDQENARLAAMGLSTGSGAAWGQSQDALNRSANDADQKAILGGFNADQQLRQSNRSDLASMLGLETGWRNNMQMPSFAQAGGANMSQIGINAPTTGTALTGGLLADQGRQQENRDQWGNLIASGVGALGKWGMDKWGGGGTGGTQPPAPVEERGWFS